MFSFKQNEHSNSWYLYLLKPYDLVFKELLNILHIKRFSDNVSDTGEMVAFVFRKGIKALSYNKVVALSKRENNGNQYFLLFPQYFLLFPISKF